MNWHLAQVNTATAKYAKDLRDLGIFNVSDLIGQGPTAMYKRLCQFHSIHIDHCVLYVFRYAVYFASEKEHAEKLLKWWNWQDEFLSDNGVDSVST